jgi:hypothetical protein
VKKTARLHIDDVGGYGSYARTYEVTPAIFDGGLGFKFVTVVVHPAREHAPAQVDLIYANKGGGPAEMSVRKRPGSFIPVSDPHEDGEHHVNGCFVWSLASHGYEIEGYGAAALPNGLDYSPDVLPE